MTLSVGDIADGKGDINRCCNLLKLEKVIAVQGNHDRWLLSNDMRSLPNATSVRELTTETKDLLNSFPKTYEFITPNGLALLCHGLGKNDMAKVNPEDFGYAIEFNPDLQQIIAEQKYRYIINGHSHCRMVRHFTNLTIINTGTLKKEHQPGFITVDFIAKSANLFEFTKNKAIEETA